MKNILKHLAVAIVLIASLGACEEFEDFSQTVEGTSKLVYVSAGEDNFFSTTISHRPVGSSGSFSTEFAVRSNSPVHSAATVSLVYDASLVETYNAEHETAYEVLPEAYLTLENTSLSLPANVSQTEETMKVSLSEEADLAALTERYYLAALRLNAEGVDASEALGAVYLLVKTEINLMRPIESTDDMIGFPAMRDEWTADCGNNAYLFDGNPSTSAGFPSENNVLTVDMKEVQKVTGLRLSGSSLETLTLEYSLDGMNWEQGGTPTADEAFSDDDAYYAAVYDYIEARYLRLSFTFVRDWWGDYSVNELDIYTIESTEPTLYLLTGENNVVSGKIVHKKGVGSTCSLDASFKVYTTVSSQSGYNGTLVADNSLVGAYNEKNGTSYTAVPSENLNIEHASFAIAAGANASTDEVHVSLTGDLSGLTAKEGYLVPLKLSSGSEAVVSTGRGVVYAVVSVENNCIRAISSADDMIGFPAIGSNWSADCEDGSNLFDGRNDSAVGGLGSSGNVITVDMKSPHMVTGLHFYTFSLSNVSIFYSADNENWESAGTVAEGEYVYNGSMWGAGDYYIAFADYLEARYLRLSFDLTGWYQNNLYEMEVYEIESTQPTIYAQCGDGNVLTGKIIQHTVAGAIPSVNASFNVLTTLISASGYEVDVRIDESLVDAYNSENGTSYAKLDASLVNLENTPCEIAPNANKSVDEVKVSLTGDLSGLTNPNGYLIPLQLAVESGDAVVSASRGVVYVAVSVETSSDPFRTNFTADDIEGEQVADRSAWEIVTCDEEGIYPDDSSGYDSLFDDSRDTYVRTWGGPITFTVDLGKPYDMTGLVITARSGYYQYMQPKSIMIEYSTDGSEYMQLGTPLTSDGNLVASVPSSYAALYSSVQVQYLRIVADYGGSNMGTAEFNIYAK